MGKLNRNLLKILIMLCLFKNTTLAFSETSNENLKEQKLLSGKDEKIYFKEEKVLEESEGMQREYNEGEEVLIKVDVKKKEEYVEGIVNNGKIYVKEASFLEVIERKNLNKNKMGNTIEIDNEKYYDLENDYENLGLKNYFFDRKTMNMRVTPTWELAYEREENILDSRERLKIQKKNNKDSQYEEEEWKMWTSGIMGIGYTRTDGNNENNSGYIRYTNNLLYGSTSINATIDDNNGDAEGKLDYAYWERNILNNKRLLIGNTYKQSNYSVSDNSGSITGITLGSENSWDSQMRVTQKQVTGYAATGTVVELYENGILKDFKSVIDGQYAFNVDLYNGSKNYTIKKYTPDGQVIVEEVTLLASESVLEKGKFDYLVDAGVIKKKESKSTFGGEVKYGILKDFTGIVGGFDLYDDNYSKQSFYKVGEVGILDIPYIKAPLYHSIVYSSDGDENSMSKYTLGLTLGKDQINYKNEDYTKLDLRFQSFTKKNDDLYYDFREMKGYNLKVGTSSREDTNDEKHRTYYGTIYKSYGLYYTSLGLNKTKNKTTGETENYISPGISYSAPSGSMLNKYIDTISIYSNIGEENTYGISLGKNNAGEWDYYLNYNNDSSNRKEMIGLMVSYTPGGKVKMSTNIQKSHYNNKPIIQNTVETNIYIGPQKPKFDYAKNMGKGSVAGKVYLDKDGNGKFDEGIDKIIKKSKIETYRNSTIADENGEFVLGGLETYSPVDVRITSDDENIPYYVSTNSHEKVKLNPGGRKQLDFGYRPVVSISTEINFGENFYREQVVDMLREMEIEFENMRTHEKHKYEFGKDDMIIKSLPVGVYSLELIYKGDSNIKIHKSKHYLALKETEESEITFDVEKLDENNFVLTVKQDYKQLFVSLEQLYSSLELEKNKYIGYKKKEIERR
ncbi:MAG: hypothetical protein ACRCXY_07880 [Fusobacteriaceae bacterium]